MRSAVAAMSADGTAGLAAADADGQARRDALAKALQRPVVPTSLVSYASRGHLLIAGPEAMAREAAQRLAGGPLTVSLLITDGRGDAHDATPVPERGDAAAAAQRSRSPGAREIRAPLAAVRGHLGAFEVDVHADGAPRPLAPSILTANRPYDLVLDLGRQPALRVDVPPPGYFAPAGDAQRLEDALAALPELIGEFEKPRYFDYDPAICAHGARGQRGCSRCLDACPTGAITSLKERIEVDAHLCQGGGTCATACPTGAIRYAYPTSADLTDRLRLLLATYRERGGATPLVLFHDGDAGAAWLAEHGAALPGHVLPFAVEEIGSVGLETWLALLAFGVDGVVLLATAATPPTVRAEIEAQLRVLDAILEALGAAAGAVAMAEAAPASEMAGLWSQAAGARVRQPAAFAGVAGKREAMRLALDHLYAQAPSPAGIAALPAHAPFGRIEVDPGACTLCMACVAVCPAGAVLAAGDRPRLDFVEQNCVQCGLCAGSCPEDAITLEARLLFDREQRAARRVLNEDAPFACVSCGKVFGTTRTVERMLEKLAGHWMFHDKPEQLRRLRMCEDCRVKDMFRDGGGLLDVDGGPRH